MEKETQHILIVDDDTRLRSLLKRFLREQGFAVSDAQDADTAFEFLNQYKFDLLIVDIMMPKISGIEFLKELRLENNVPVIMLTAMGETADRIVGLESGADDYIAKPFEPLELVLRIKNILKRAPVEKNDNQAPLNLGLCLYDVVKKSLPPSKGQLSTLHRLSKCS